MTTTDNLEDLAKRKPIEKLALAILLSADKKHATEIWIRREGDQPLIDFKVAGEWRHEMHPLIGIYGGLLREFCVMGSVPSYGPDEYAFGRIILSFPTGRSITFDIEVHGHDDSLEAFLRVPRSERRLGLVP